MGITILSPYKLFFIDQSDFLFALMKDGRQIQIQKAPYFPCLSSDGQRLSGISFDGENSHIFQMPFSVDSQLPTEILSLFGYFYYPSFSKNNKKLAVIEADLLNQRPAGELRIYQKKIKRWYKKDSLPAKMKPVLWDIADEAFFYINAENQLIKVWENKRQLIAENVQLFNISHLKNEIIYLSDGQIFIHSLLKNEIVFSIPAHHVTALCFDKTGTSFFYATSFENRHAVYEYSRISGKSTLLVQSKGPVLFLGS